MNEKDKSRLILALSIITSLSHDEKQELDPSLSWEYINSLLNDKSVIEEMGCRNSDELYNLLLVNLLAFNRVLLTRIINDEEDRTRWLNEMEMFIAANMNYYDEISLAFGMMHDSLTLGVPSGTILTVIPQMSADSALMVLIAIGLIGASLSAQVSASKGMTPSEFIRFSSIQLMSK